MALDRVDVDEHGQLDDVVITNSPLVRLERMTDDCFWLSVTRPDGSIFVVHFTAVGSELLTSHEED